MLKIKSLSKTFNPGAPDEVRVLKDLDLEVEEGSFLMVVGSNGSGKSSLLNAIAGVFPCDAGSIWLDGVDISDYPEHRRASSIGRVFQNPFSGTAPGMTIAENLGLAAGRGSPRGLGPAINKKLLASFAEAVKPLGMGLEERLHAKVGTLSGGQRQALTLLMAGWQTPRLLLLDEHTAALDPKTAATVIHLTTRLIEKHNITTIMVTHSMQQAVSLGHRLIMMHKGRVIEDFSGARKQRLKPADLIALFDDLRKKEHIDHTVADLLLQQYI